MSERQKGVKALNPLTILYLVIALAVVSAIFDYRVTLATVVVMIVIAASAGEGVSFIKLWLKSIVLICVIRLRGSGHSGDRAYDRKLERDLRNEETRASQKPVKATRNKKNGKK